MLGWQESKHATTPEADKAVGEITATLLVGRQCEHSGEKLGNLSKVSVGKDAYHQA